MMGHPPIGLFSLENAGRDIALACFFMGWSRLLNV